MDGTWSDPGWAERVDREATEAARTLSFGKLFKRDLSDGWFDSTAPIRWVTRRALFTMPRHEFLAAGIVHETPSEKLARDRRRRVAVLRAELDRPVSKSVGGVCRTEEEW